MSDTTTTTDSTVRAIDLFAGAGGLSEGLRQACERLGRSLDLDAVNHWDTAIETHQANHQDATHWRDDVMDLNPAEVVDSDETVHVLTGGAECTHFSSARGGVPVSEQKRMPMFRILDWVDALEPQLILLENVKEIRSWGPVVNGRATRNATLWNAWLETLRDELEYNISHRVINCADYGDATSRRRLFILATRSGDPVWPTPTHAETGRGDREPWRTAADIIDWTDAGHSIWARGLDDTAVSGRKPLKNTTMQRIAKGLRDHGGEAETDGVTVADFADSLDGLTRDDVRALQESIVSVDRVSTDAVEAGKPFLVKYYGTSTTSSVDSPIGAVTTSGRHYALCQPFLLGQQSNAQAKATDESPVPTIAQRGAIALYRPNTFVLPRNGRQGGLHSNATYDPRDEPLHTVTARNSDGHVVGPQLVSCESAANGSPTEIPSVTALEPHLALVVPELYPAALELRYRMLKPSELAAAQGFPPDYEFRGNKTDRTAQIGKSVPVRTATELFGQLLSQQAPTLSSFASEPECAARVDGDSLGGDD